jgi:hypothetical protein
MSAKDDKARKNAPTYLTFTAIEELIDDGLQFEGVDEKTRAINQTDFVRIRELVQNLVNRQMITKDMEDTLVRCLKACIKELAA